ncbi:hypothetical protein ACOKW7_27685 [Limnospira platensis CENA597]|uniref:hypothetical protein n=1 Tax=Limnospira platensis TaxID=118562 RepID=UPI003DA07CF0
MENSQQNPPRQLILPGIGRVYLDGRGDGELTAEPAPTINNYQLSGGLGRVYSDSPGDGEFTAEPAPTINHYQLIAGDR